MCPTSETNTRRLFRPSTGRDEEHLGCFLHHSCALFRSADKFLHAAVLRSMSKHASEAPQEADPSITSSRELTRKHETKPGTMLIVFHFPVSRLLQHLDMHKAAPLLMNRERRLSYRSGYTTMYNKVRVCSPSLLAIQSSI